MTILLHALWFAFCAVGFFCAIALAVDADVDKRRGAQAFWLLMALASSYGVWQSVTT